MRKDLSGVVSLLSIIILANTCLVSPMCLTLCQTLIPRYSLKPHNKPMMLVPLSTFYRRGNWSTKSVSYFAIVPQSQSQYLNPGRLRSKSKLLTVLLYASSTLYCFYVMSTSLFLAFNFCPYYSSCILVGITTSVSNNFCFSITNKKFSYKRNLII